MPDGAGAARRRPLIVGNWKMHGSREKLCDVAAIDAAARGIDCILCLPATLIPLAAARVRHMMIGAQDCHAAAGGPYTGGVSAAMLADAGATWVIVGHSECRASGVTDRDVAAKFAAATPYLRPILCVGEDRKEGHAQTVRRQLEMSLPKEVAVEALTVAYEPVWAIGTDMTPSPEEIAHVHAALHATLAARFGPAGRDVPILYGGSVSAGNAEAILAQGEVAGLLVGRASLTIDSFLPILQQA